MPGRGRPHLLLGGLGQVPQAAGHAHQALLKGRHQVGLKEMGMGCLRCRDVGGGWVDSGGLREDQCQLASWQPLNLASHSGLKTCLGHRHHHGGAGLWRHLEARLSSAPREPSPLGPWLYPVSLFAQSPPPPRTAWTSRQPRAPEPLLSVLPAFPRQTQLKALGAIPCLAARCQACSTGARGPHEACEAGRGEGPQGREEGVRRGGQSSSSASWGAGEVGAEAAIREGRLTEEKASLGGRLSQL